MPHTQSIAALLSLFRERDNFLVTSHARPDGDAIGSAVGLMHLLEAMGKRATVAFADPIPQIYNCLPGVERIVHTLPTGIDTAILLECDSIERSGYQRIDAAMTVNIDHHRSARNFANVNWIDPDACAVGIMVYDLAIASGLPISPGMANCLYAAILTDTGSFSFASTTADTFRAAAHLVDAGADASRITQAVYFSNPPAKLRLLGTALRNLQIEGCVAWSSITVAEMEAAGALVEDCEGVVNHLIGIADVQAAAFIRAQPNNIHAQPGSEYRLSLRSRRDTDVARVAEHFGGGGHRNASGCTLSGTLAEVTAAIVPALREACSALPASPLSAATLLA